ncbi:hypothetical protein BaRGS_00033085, partial [Batillaria attramentaria]
THTVVKMAFPRSVVLCLVLFCSPLAGASALKKPAKRQDMEDMMEAAAELQMAITAVKDIYTNPLATFPQFEEAVEDLGEAAGKFVLKLKERPFTGTPLAANLQSLMAAVTAFEQAVEAQAPGTDYQTIYMNLWMAMTAVETSLQMCMQSGGGMIIDDKRSVFARA